MPKKYAHAAMPPMLAVAALMLAVARTAAAATTELRVAEYNIDDSDQGNNNNITAANAGVPAVLEAIGLHHIGTNAQPIDILALTELLDTNNNSVTSSTLPLVVSSLNNYYGAGTYAYATTPDPTSGGTQFNGPSGIIYNTHTVSVVSATTLALGSGINRAPIRYLLQPVGYGANSDFYMYVDHYKASSGSTNESERNSEAIEVRANADTLGSSAHVIFTGDFNLTNASAEAAYATLTAAGGSGQAHDPLTTSWLSNSSAYTYLYSDATSGSFAMSARFDMQLVSNATLTQPGLQLAADTSDPYDPKNFPSAKYPYAEEVFGNNGSTALGQNTNLATNTSLGDLPNASTILNDLMQPSGSDHLPIVADYKLVGVTPVAQAVTWVGGHGNTWSGASNWLPIVVPTNSFPLSYAVTMNSGTAALDINPTINSLTITSGTLTGTGNLTLSSGTISGTYNVTGITTIVADAITATPAGTLTFNGTTHNAGAFTGAGNIVINPGATLTSNGITLNQLTVNGHLIVRSNGTATGTSRVNNFALAGSTGAWTGSLDLTNNKLIVEAANATKATAIATLQNQVQSYGQAGSLGITSTGIPGNQAIAVVDNGALATPFTVFGGVAVDLNSILTAPELLGDTDLSGTVDLNDLNTVLNDLGQTSSAWTSGNFDGAPTIDLNDLNDVLNNLGASFPSASNEVGLAESLLAGVTSSAPEPASLAIIFFAAPWVLRRRR